MQRFWIFPVVLGMVGALYPFVTTMQGWAMTFVTIGLFAAPSEITDSVVIGALIGVGLGVAAAWSDLSRHLAQDRSGVASGRRLEKNLFWFGVYAIVVNTLNSVVLVGIAKAFVPRPLLQYWMPAMPFLLFGDVNLVAIVGATVATTSSENVLSPRVLRERFNRSARIEG